MQNINFPFALLSDIIVVLLLIGFAFWGRRRGFIKMISGVVVLVLAISVAVVLTKWTTPYISSNFVQPHIEELLLPEIQDGSQTSSADTVQDTDDSKLSALLVKLGIPTDSLTGAIDELKEETASSVEDAVVSLSATVSKKVTYGICFVVYFLICLLIFTLLARLLNLAAKLPVINFFNRSGGFVLGIIWGYIAILIIGLILKRFHVIPPSLIQDTTVLEFILTRNPLSLLPIW